MRPLATTALLVAFALSAHGCQTTESISDEIDFGLPEGDTRSILDSQLERYREKVREYPRLDDVHFKIAMIHFQREDFREAEHAIRKAVELEPANVKYQYNLGRIHLRMKEYDEAAEAFSDAVEAYGRGKQVNLHSALGYTLCLGKRWEEARKEFETCVEIAPDNPVPYYFLGSIADIYDDSDQTIRLMREYIERGGRLFRERAIEILNQNGVAVEIVTPAQKAALEEGIDPSGLKLGFDDGPKPSLSVPDASESIPATVEGK